MAAVNSSLTGADYVSLVKGTAIEFDDSDKRVCRSGGMWTKADADEFADVVVNSRGLHVTLTKMSTTFGVISNDSKAQLQRDLNKIIEALWGSWDTAYQEIDTRSENEENKSLLWTAVAGHLFSLWDAAIQYDDDPRFRTIFEKYVGYRVREQRKVKVKSEERASHGRDTPKESANTNANESTEESGPTGRLRPKSPTKPRTPVKRNASLSTSPTRTPKRPRIVKPECDADPSWTGNTIPLSMISLLVSRDTNWTGVGLPSDGFHVKPISAFLSPGQAALYDATSISTWLLSEKVDWKPEHERLVVLTPDDNYERSVDKDLDELVDIIAQQHRNNQVQVKMKLVSTTPVTEAAPIDPARTAHTVAEETEAVDDVDGVAFLLEDIQIHDGDSRGDDLSPLKTTVINIPPPPPEKIAPAEILMANFTKNQYNEARAFFNLPPVKKMKAEQVKIKWITKLLWPHQIMFLCQGTRKLIQNGSLFEADEQGLGKTLQTVGLIWLNKLMVYMDESIQYWRQSGSNPDSDEKKFVRLHEHLQADAPKGSKCPSAKHWPIQCRCQPDSFTATIPVSRRPSIVYPHVIRTIPAWAKEVDEFSDAECPFLFSALIGNASQKNLTGYTRVIKGSVRPLNSREEEVPAECIQPDDGTEEYPSSASGYVILSNHQSAQKHVFKLVKNVSFHIIAVDESHLSTGPTSSFMTQLLYGYASTGNIMDEISSDEELHADSYPSSFVFISGTPWKDIKDVQCYWKIITGQIQALRAIWQRVNDTHSEDLLTTTASEHKAILDFDFNLTHAKNRDKTQTHSRKKWGDPELKAHGEEFGACMAALTIRRTNNTRIPEPFPFNTPIVGLKRLHVHNVEVSYNEDEKNTCNAFVGTLQSNFGGSRFGKKENTTVDNGPGKKKDNTIDMNMLNTMFSTQIETCQAVASLPSVARLINDGAFDEWGDLSNTVAGKPNVKFTMTNMKEFGYHNKEDHLRKKVAAACKNDPKIRQIREIIKGIMKDDDKDIKAAKARQLRDPDKFVGDPEDYLQKIAVVSQSVFTTLTIFDVMEQEFPEVDFGMINGWKTQQETAEVINSFQDEVDEKSEKGVFKSAKRPRVLVAVTRNVSTGINLHRGNHLIIAEPSPDPSQEAQTGSRQHRIGQQRECWIYRLHADGMKVEELVRDKKKKREWLMAAAKEMGYRVVGADQDEGDDDFIEDENESEAIDDDD
ncbi:hypothetical protein HBH82_108060 [Parastagonospora nodorum]|nr:hypothetical protein HBH82_108060 [Parastagonospora nodorum]KAH4658719.1 hypothetical protein HBH78_237610 [Parastagonospora nodorum]KAH4697344.1 hypothetical protein HBH67_181130 [Parastagonospora nodorum]KAH4765422.1 hypothetical protein HBH63_177990 [Parastagonospora nodorum]KAH4792303.1 hypothetical protein HBH62_026580 [Parastagonospora nodorum]